MEIKVKESFRLSDEQRSAFYAAVDAFNAMLKTCSDLGIGIAINEERIRAWDMKSICSGAFLEEKFFLKTEEARVPILHKNNMLPVLDPHEVSVVTESFRPVHFFPQYAARIPDTGKIYYKAVLRTNIKDKKACSGYVRFLDINNAVDFNTIEEAVEFAKKYYEDNMEEDWDNTSVEDLAYSLLYEEPEVPFCFYTEDCNLEGYIFYRVYKKDSEES